MKSFPDYRERNAIEQFARAGDPRGLCFRFALDVLPKNTGGITLDLYASFEKTDGWGRRAMLADLNSPASIKISCSSADPFIAKLVA